jgi:crossover junction endodeoxyribonuclease RuvC
MKTLSIDPGYERLGIAIIEKTNEPGAHEKLLFSECFKTSPKDPHPDRLAQIQNRIFEIIDEFTPETLAIETLFFNANVKTALLVAEARGTILASARSKGLEIFEYSPQQIKTSVTGDGRSDKTSVIKMIPLLIKIVDESGTSKEIKHDDEYDAIAAGLCFFASDFRGFNI